jgi:hypothetical protein
MTIRSALAPFLRKRGFAPDRAVEGDRCELCAAPIGETHRHVIEHGVRALKCVCPACAILFSSAERYRTVPERVREVTLSDEAWAALGLPVKLAWIVAGEKWAAFYPSPAGPVEATLAELPPELPALAPEVEALLVRRPEDALVVPIDACLELAGLVRRHWRGFHGGDEVRRRIDELFRTLRSRSRR